MTAARKSETQVKVWYDGACPLCIREIRFMRRLDRDKRIAFVDISPADAICPLDRQLMLDRFHAEENGRILSGAAAFAAMWRALPLLRPLGRIARNQVVLKILEAGYRLFLRIRPQLQKLVPASKTSS
ncbi:MAG: DUF393 domain-containing protein [Pseudomonadota bacterium]